VSIRLRLSCGSLLKTSHWAFPSRRHSHAHATSSPLPAWVACGWKDGLPCLNNTVAGVLWRSALVSLAILFRSSPGHGFVCGQLYAVTHLLVLLFSFLCCPCVLAPSVYTFGRGRGRAFGGGATRRNACKTRRWRRTRRRHIGGRTFFSFLHYLFKRRFCNDVLLSLPVAFERRGMINRLYTGAWLRHYCHSSALFTHWRIYGLTMPAWRDASALPAGGEEERGKLLSGDGSGAITPFCWLLHSGGRGLRLPPATRAPAYVPYGAGNARRRCADAQNEGCAWRGARLVLPAFWLRTALRRTFAPYIKRVSRTARGGAL
jgi:hypothetical protein